ncbi:MAG TPA: hypothetical protein VIP51_13340 [Eoetvoesiella sp.]
MRFLFLLIVAANVALFAFGQGLFGLPPSEEGRTPRKLLQHNQQAVVLGQPSETYTQAPYN